MVLGGSSWLSLSDSGSSSDKGQGYGILMLVAFWETLFQLAVSPLELDWPSPEAGCWYGGPDGERGSCPRTDSRGALWSDWRCEHYHRTSKDVPIVDTKEHCHPAVDIHSAYKIWLGLLFVYSTCSCCSYIHTLVACSSCAEMWLRLAIQSSTMLELCSSCTGGLGGSLRSSPILPDQI